MGRAEQSSPDMIKESWPFIYAAL